MLTLITGNPGAGKSAALVDMLTTQLAQAERIVYVDGIPELQLPHLPFEPLKWQEPDHVQDGSILVVDEAWRHWPAAATGSRVPPAIEAMATHRHRGLDIYLVCQGPKQLHTSIRTLVGRHVYLRDLGLMGGRWWYEFPECNDHTRAKQAPIKKKYNLPKRVFGQYKSASLHVKPVRSVPPTVIILGVSLVAVGCLAWYSVSRYQAKMAPPKPAAAPGATVQAKPGSTPQPIRITPSMVPGLAVAPPVLQREPYAGFGVHLAGSYTVGEKRTAFYTLTIDRQTVATVSQDAISKAGYAVRFLAPCAAVMTFGDKERLIRCDAPARAPMQPTAPAAAASAPV